MNPLSGWVPLWAAVLDWLLGLSLGLGASCGMLPLLLWYIHDQIHRPDKEQDREVFLPPCLNICLVAQPLSRFSSPLDRWACSCVFYALGYSHSPGYSKRFDATPSPWSSSQTTITGNNDSFPGRRGTTYESTLGGGAQTTIESIVSKHRKPKNPLSALLYFGGLVAMFRSNYVWDLIIHNAIIEVIVIVLWCRILSGGPGHTWLIKFGHQSFRMRQRSAVP